MKTINKIVIMVVAVLVIFGIAYLADVYLFDQGEDTQAIPDVGIKAAVLDPTFVTAGGQPLLLVYVKGDASQVTAEVAKRVAPTKGGETLATYELAKLDRIIPAEKINEDDTGELQVWGSFLDVPEDAGQYLVTAIAYDQKNTSTKFKMFNYIMSVQLEEDLESIPGSTPGQASFLNFVKKITAEEYEEAYEYFAPELRENLDLDTFTETYGNLKDAEVANFGLVYLEMASLSENDQILVKYPSSEEHKWQINFAVNGEDPEADWQITSIEKIIE
ncbi:hypothetical protein ACFL0Z_02785 [Patescibacteria group bacterium]